MRKEITRRDGYNIIKRGSSRHNNVRIDCPLCGCVTIDEIDTNSIIRSGCCFECEIEVADPNRSKWIAGWRPDENDVEMIKLKRLSSPHSR